MAKRRVSCLPLVVVTLILATAACRPKPSAAGDAGGDASPSEAWSKTSLATADIVSTIAVDPKDPKTIFLGVSAGSTDRGFFRTKDRGKTWSKLGGGLPDRY